MNIKKLGLEIVLFVFFIGVIILFFEWKYKYYKTAADYIFEEIETKKDAITHIYYGNSHVGALGKYNQDQNAIVMNMSTHGTDLFKAYTILRKYMPLFPKLKYIYLGLDYEMLGQNQSLGGEEFLDRQFYKYTDTLYKYNFASKIMASSNFFRANRDLNYFFASEKEKSIALEQKANNFIPITNTSLFNESQCKKRALEHSAIRFKQHLMVENLGYVQSIINLFKKSNIQLIIFNPPKRKCFKENVKKENSYLAKQKIDSLLISNKIKYYDFWNDSSFVDNDFLDNDHLNKNGGVKMMNKLPI